MPESHKDPKLYAALRLIDHGLQQKSEARARFAHQENIGKPSADSLYYWGTYRSNAVLEDAQQMWEAFASNEAPEIIDWIQGEVRRLKESGAKSKFNVAELGGPGGFCQDLALLFKNQLGQLVAVSLGDGRPADVRQKHDKLGVQFVPGDLVQLPVWSELRKQVSADGYNLIFANLIGGWEDGIPESRTIHALLLKRALRLLAVGGVLMSDYYVEGSRSLEGLQKSLESFVNRNSSRKYEVRVLSHHIWVKRVL